MKVLLRRSAASIQLLLTCALTALVTGVSTGELRMPDSQIATDCACGADHGAEADGQVLPPPFRKCGFTSFTVKRMQDILAGGQQVQMRRITQFSTPSPSGRFLIHYDVDGVDGVADIDENNNNVPDYVDSVAFYFDHAWRVEVDEIGFGAPPADGNNGGSAAYDIYLEDLGPRGIYGLTVPESSAGSGGRFGRFTTFIIIDNNFSPLDKTGDGVLQRQSYFEKGIRALRVTAAHEFHHAIQLGAYGSVQSECSIHEFSSTWAEFRLHPDVYDLEQFIPSLFRNLDKFNFGNNDCDVGYHYGVFAQMLQSRLGDAAMLNTWAAVTNSNNGYDALDEGLRILNSSLADEYCAFSDWLYHTDYRDRGEELVRGSTYPLVTFHTVERFSEPSINLSGGLKPFEQRFIRLLFPQSEAETPDTVDLALVNLDLLNAGETDDATVAYSVICTSTPREGAEPIGNTGYYLSVSSDRENLFCYSKYLNTGVLTNAPPAVFPNPFVVERDEQLFFPLQPNIDVDVQSAVLTVYDAAMAIVYSDEAPLSVENNLRVVAWNGRTALGDQLSSGVYIYTLEYKDSQSAGKFLVKRTE